MHRNNISLSEWFKKHNVSTTLTSTEYAIKRAVIHAQNEHELQNID